MLLATVVILTSGLVYAVLANCQPLWCCIFEYLLRRDPRTPFRGYDPKFGGSSYGLAADRPRETAFGHRFGTPGNSGEVDSAAPPFRTSQRFVSDARCVVFSPFYEYIVFHFLFFILGCFAERLQRRSRQWYVPAALKAQQLTSTAMLS